MKGKIYNMKRKFYPVLLLILLVVITFVFTGCNIIRSSKTASYNISREADEFNIYRNIKVINNQSDSTMLEFSGWCSINKDNEDNQLEIIYRVGKDKYYKDYIGLNDRVTYVVTQLDGSDVDRYSYEWLYHSKGKLIPINVKDADKDNNEEK